MDQHQLVVVQNEVVKLRHAAERIVAYPRQPVTTDQTQTEIDKTDYNTLYLPRGFHAKLIISLCKSIPVEV